MLITCSNKIFLLMKGLCTDSFKQRILYLYNIFNTNTNAIHLNRFCSWIFMAHCCKKLQYALVNEVYEQEILQFRILAAYL